MAAVATAAPQTPFACRMARSLSYNIYMMGAMCFIGALTTPWWSRAENFTAGLVLTCWKSEGDDNGDWPCTLNSIPDFSWEHAGTVILMAVSCVVHVVAVANYVYSYTRPESFTTHVRTATAACITSGVLTLTACQLYASMFLEPEESLGRSVFLGRVSAGTELLNGAVVVLGFVLSGHGGDSTRG